MGGCEFGQRTRRGSLRSWPPPSVRAAPYLVRLAVVVVGTGRDDSEVDEQRQQLRLLDEARKVRVVPGEEGAERMRIRGREATQARARIWARGWALEAACRLAIGVAILGSWPIAGIIALVTACRVAAAIGVAGSSAAHSLPELAYHLGGVDHCAPTARLVPPSEQLPPLCAREWGIRRASPSQRRRLCRAGTEAEAGPRGWGDKAWRLRVTARDQPMRRTDRAVAIRIHLVEPRARRLLLRRPRDTGEQPHLRQQQGELPLVCNK